MKRTLLMLLVALFTQCTKAPLLSLSDKKPNQVIALQPLDDYNVQEIQTIVAGVQQFYKKRVQVLPAITIPSHWFNAKTGMYAADSIIQHLANFSNHSIVEVIGLTHHPLFTIKQSKGIAYYDTHIIGLGYQPGHACVVSDYNIFTADTTLYTYRLRNAILHEVGHNMGLEHCSNEHCLMSEKNSGTDYCASCRHKLKE